MTALLLRPQPFFDESLSSWRQRVGWGNLYKLFPVSDERTRRVDADLAANEEDLQYVELLHNSNAQVVRNHTLRRWQLQLGSRIVPHSHPQWWLGAAYGSTDAQHGSMYCPICLRDDVVPYFRLRWRLSFVTTCDKHNVRLRDTCPHCGRAPWPAGCGRKTVMHPKFTNLRRCWHCGEDLAQATLEVPQGDQYLWRTLSAESIDLVGVPTPTHEVFAAHRMIWRMLAKGVFRKRILAAFPHWERGFELLPRQARAPKLDQLGIDARAILCNLSFEVLREGSQSFVRFSRRCGFQQTDFHEIKEGAPSWILDAITRDLATNNCMVTVKKIEEAYRAIELETGQRPTKAAVRKRLNWNGEKGMDQVFTKARKASSDEKKRFINRVVELGLNEIRGKRSARCQLVYACVLLSSLLLKRDSSFFHRMPVITKAEALDTFVRLSRDPNLKSSELGEAWIDLLPRVLTLRDTERQELLATEVAKSVLRKRLVLLMRDLPDDLPRQIEVFSC